MRADRLIVDAMEGSEALDLIQGINNGHKGALATFSAASPRDAVAKLEIMMMQGNPSLPLLGARESMAAAVDVIVCLDRLKDKKRRMVSVTEVTGITNGVPDMQDIFRFVPQDTSGEIVTGTFSGTGNLPRLLSRLKSGSLPLDMFAPRA
jgi:pilus assembly protein CpaF